MTPAHGAKSPPEIIGIYVRNESQVPCEVLLRLEEDQVTGSLFPPGAESRMIHLSLEGHSELKQVLVVCGSAVTRVPMDRRFTGNVDVTVVIGGAPRVRPGEMQVRIEDKPRTGPPRFFLH